MNGDGEGVVIRQNLGLEAKLPFMVKGKDIGLGGEFNSEFNTNDPNGSVVYNYNVLLGVPILKGQTPSNKVKVGKDKDFKGLSININAAAFIGFDIKLQIGNEKK